MFLLQRSGSAQFPCKTIKLCTHATVVYFTFHLNDHSTKQIAIDHYVRDDLLAGKGCEGADDVRFLRGIESGRAADGEADAAELNVEQLLVAVGNRRQLPEALMIGKQPQKAAHEVRQSQLARLSKDMAEGGA